MQWYQEAIVKDLHDCVDFSFAKRVENYNNLLNAETILQCRSMCILYKTLALDPDRSKDRIPLPQKQIKIHNIKII